MPDASRTRSIIIVSLALGVAGCGHPPAPVQCPDAAAVAPASIGGAGYVAGLTARLAGPDRENVVAEAIGEMRRADPGIDTTTMTNVLVAADCPVAAGKPDSNAGAVRHRVTQFRAQVDAQFAQ